MAQWDDAENQDDQPYPSNDGNAQSRSDFVAQLYRTALGREGSPQEIAQWANGPLSIPEMQQAIYSSPEAQAWGARNANPGPKPTETGTTTPPSNTPPPSYTGSTAGPAGSATSAAAAPNMPNIPNAPAFVAPPPFEYEAFKGPTGDDVLNDADYQLTRDQGIQSIGHKNAALGTLNTGGTIGDYVGFASNLAHAKYNDLYNRDFGTYQANRGNAFDAWKANYGVAKDVYDTNYQTQYSDPFGEGMQQAGLSQNNSQFNAQLGQNNNQFNSTFDFQKWLENYKRDVTDPFERKYRTLGLL